MHETIPIHKAIKYSKSKGVVIAPEHHKKILCQSSEMLAFKSMQRMHLLEAFLFLQKILFCKIHKYTVQKVVSNIFEINLKIN